jgi:hypothetical protein
MRRIYGEQVASSAPTGARGFVVLNPVVITTG